MQKRIDKIFIILLFFLPQIFFAQFKIDLNKKNPISNLTLHSWTTEDGLPTNDIYEIIMSKDGFYYLGTSDGLVRFDGGEFKIFSARNTKEFKANLANNLFLDSKNRIWISNGGAGAIVYNGEIFTNINEDNGLSVNNVAAFAEDKSGNIYLGTRGGGINVYNKKIISVINNKSGLPSNFITALHFDRKNRLWIGTNTSELVYLENGNIKKITRKTIPVHSRTVMLLEDSFGTIWAATDRGIVKTINGDYYPVDKPLEVLNNYHIHQIIEDDEKNLWISTLDGVYFYNRTKIIKLNNLNGFPSTRISFMINDELGLWMCGSGSGLMRYTVNNLKVFSEENGLPNSEIKSLFQDKLGQIWIGTNKGIVQFDEKSENVIPLKNKFPTVLAYSWESNSKGDIFIGTRHNGVLKYSGGKITTIADKKILGVNFVRSLLLEDDGTLWIGTNGSGVAIFRNGNFSFVDRSSGLKSQFISCITKDRNGNFWVGSSGGGVSILDNEGNVKTTFTEKEGLASNIVNTILEDELGNMWISTSVSGISRINNGKIFNISETDGIYSNTSKKMLYDNKGKFWFTTESGLFSCSNADFNNLADGKISHVTFDLYGKKDGMKSEEFMGVSDNTAFTSSSGKLYFSTTNGVVLIDPDRLVKKDETVRAFIDEIFVSYNHADKSNLKELPPGTEIIQFNYGGVSVSHPKNLTFKYTLEGIDDKWIDAGKRRQAFFTHLPNGDYTFKVYAVAPDGKKSSNIAAISFTIKPFIWQTYWFRIGFLVLLVSVSVLLVRNNLRKKFKARLQKIQAETAIERERIRISHDMHDELGASLTNISLLTELAIRNLDNPSKLFDDLKNISAASQDVAVTMDEIVWAINPKNDSLDRMISYIAQYAEDLMSRTKIDFKTQIEREIPDKYVSAEIRHNTFLVIKEAMNNIIKHSKATQANLVIEINSGLVTIKIRDNGQGFDLNKINKFSEGLVSMQKRICDINGNFVINTEELNGTEVILKIST
jgi:ligand-binding sensor domain-containing protein/signal transduction histidine kinase